MQNYYAVERFIQEHNQHARAVAELQALRRRAVAERRTARWAAWREWLRLNLARRTASQPLTTGTVGSGK